MKIIPKGISNKTLIFEIISRAILLLTLVISFLVLVVDCEIYLFYRKMTSLSWVITLLLALIIESISIFLQKKNDTFSVLNLKSFMGYLFVVLILSVLIVVLSFSGLLASKEKARDARIKAQILEAEEAMTSVYKKKGNYDSFNCKNRKMTQLCEKIDKMYEKPSLIDVRCKVSFEKDGEEPIIVHNKTKDSQSACIYSPLNQSGSYWYCLDSSGRKGKTKINPNQSGYCVEEKSAVCPAVNN